MKKNLLAFFFSAAVVITANAQVTITQADMPLIGKAYVQTNDTLVSSAGGSGTGQTWNFSSWGNNGGDTTAMYTPSSVPGSSYFPTATLASYNVDNNGFYKITSTGFEILGLYGDFTGGGNNAPIYFNPTQKMITFPSSYNTTYNNPWGLDLVMFYGQSGIDSIKVHIDATYSSIMDGEGTITTPYVAGVSVIRQKVTEKEVSNSFIKGAMTGNQWVSSGQPADSSTAYSYRWWGNTVKFPLAEASADSNDVVVDGSYYSGEFTAPPLGVNPVREETSISVFPNPASDVLNITGVPAAACMVVLDVQGRILESSLIKKSNSKINVASYQNGIYFYQLVDLKGNILDKGKFAVAR